MRWRTWIGVGLAALTATELAVAVGLAALAARPVLAAELGPAATPTAIVSLGDSFISGEGGRWLGNGSAQFGPRSGTDRAAIDCGEWGCEYDAELVYGASEENACHRSDLAPIRSARVAVEETVNLACSGARTANVWPAALGGEAHFGEPPQTDQLATVARRLEVRMIVLTVGANDLSFGELTAGCALDWARSPEDDPQLCHVAAQETVEAALPAAQRSLEKALRGIRATMAAAGYRQARAGEDLAAVRRNGEYRLVVMGYASPFPPGRRIRYPEQGWSRLREGGCPIWDADADWAAGQGTDSIVAMMGSATAAGGAEFLDLRHALDGHQLCDRRSHRVGPAGPSPLSAEWVRRLSFVQGSARESLHPNAYGQRAIGACIGLLYARPRGNYACHDTPGEFLSGMRIDLVP